MTIFLRETCYHVLYYIAGDGNMGKSVIDIYMSIIKEVVANDKCEENNEIENRKTDYKNFLNFIKTVFGTLSLKTEEPSFAKLNETVYEEVKREIVTLCKDYSYNNFANWIKKAKDNPFRLYYINEENGIQKMKQIIFYKVMLNIMYRIFQEIHVNGDKELVKAEEIYNNSCKIYNLLEEQIRLFFLLPTDNDSNRYENLSNEDLVKEFKNLENADKEKRDTKEDIEVLNTKIYLLCEILDRTGMANKKEYSKKFRDLQLERGKKISRNHGRHVKPDIIKKKELVRNIRNGIILDEMEYGPNYVDLVSRCRREMIQQPNKDISKIIEEKSEEIKEEKLKGMYLWD